MPICQLQAELCIKIAGLDKFCTDKMALGREGMINGILGSYSDLNKAIKSLKVAKVSKWAEFDAKFLERWY